MEGKADKSLNLSKEERLVNFSEENSDNHQTLQERKEKRNELHKQQPTLEQKPHPNKSPDRSKSHQLSLHH
ncbi:MAG: hypothetical protein LBB13_02590 [Rickettsiales bacterium]|jgi:hypothetical protein|nr:hypothetical protein [Rickettsiales bacterium]